MDQRAIERMHSDIDALEVARAHYRRQLYASDELRNAKNKIRRLLRDIMRITLELHYVRAALKVWMEHARHLWVELMCRKSLKQILAQEKVITFWESWQL